MNILVAGIGNIFEGDDAFGCEVARVLMTRALPDSVRVVDFGIRGIDLAYALIDERAKPDLTILVDATRQGDVPGTVYTLEPNLDDFRGNAMPDSHSMDPMRVLQMAQSLGGELGRILLVGCEPADLGGDDGRMGLTPPVAEAVERAADIVVSLVQEHHKDTPWRFNMFRKVAGGLLMALAITAVVISIPDIKRYIKISMM